MPRKGDGATPTEQLEGRRVRERFERLLAAGITIAAEHSTDTVLQRIVESARTVVGARYAALGVIGEDRETLTRFETVGLSREEHEAIGALPSGHGLLGVLIRDAKPVRIPRISKDTRRFGFPPNHPPMESFLGVPIVGRQQVYGNLYLTEKIGAEEFSDEDERIAVLLAAQAATAIETARLIERQDGLVAQLQTLQRQRDQFFAMMNHELRNALTGVYGWAEQLLRARNDAAAKRAGTEVYESAERTITLLNNLLDLSRLDAGKAQPMFHDVWLGDVIVRAVSHVGPAAEARGVTLRQELQSSPVQLHTDPLRLEQVLINLLTNAIRHSPPKEAIVIRVEAATPDEVHLSVSDRGNGIAQADQAKIFEPYIRVDPESGLGSGLGLPVSRRLTELLGGRLTVHSDLGKGATFTIILPAMKKPSPDL